MGVQAQVGKATGGCGRPKEEAEGAGGHCPTVVLGLFNEVASTTHHIANPPFLQELGGKDGGGGGVRGLDT